MSIKKIIIIVVIVAVAFIGYSMLISGNEKQSASGISRQAVSGGTAAVAGSSALLDGPGKEFVTQLLAIQNIKFNLDLFADPVFIGLQDWSREIVPQETGRPNPFAPLEGNISLGESVLSSFSNPNTAFIEGAKASVGSAGGTGTAKSSAGASTVKNTTTTR